MLKYFGVCVVVVAVGVGILSYNTSISHKREEKNPEQVQPKNLEQHLSLLPQECDVVTDPSSSQDLSLGQEQLEYTSEQATIPLVQHPKEGLVDVKPVQLAPIRKAAGTEFERLSEILQDNPELSTQDFVDEIELQFKKKRFNKKFGPLSKLLFVKRNRSALFENESTFDFHHMTKKNAKWAIELILSFIQNFHQSIILIAGKGKVLRAFILQLLKELRIQCSIDPKNEGRINVHFAVTCGATACIFPFIFPPIISFLEYLLE